MSKKRYIVLLSLMVFFSLTYSSILNMFNFQKKNLSQKEVILKSSGYWVLNSIIIDDTGGGDYTWAEAAAEDWCSGTGIWSDPYVIENVTINANHTGSALLIRNSDVYFRIENCTLYNSGSSWSDAGITLYYAENGYLIKNNCSFNNKKGINVEYSSHNTTIESNIVNNNTGIGIHIFFSDESSIINNQVNFNDLGLRIYECINHLVLNNNFTFSIETGIYMDSNSDYSIIQKNNCSNNGMEGMVVFHCFNNTIAQNICDNNKQGIAIYNSLNQTIKSNNISNNAEYGVRLYESSYNTLSNNKVRNNTLNGLELRDFCSHNTFYDNEVYNNQGYGIFIPLFNNYSLIYQNYFYNNFINAYDSGSNNEWDNGVIGNYWDDCTGSGPYVISGGAGSQDNYPIYNPYDIPGVEGYIPLNQTIKVGLLADLNHFIGDDAWKGATLAAKEINEAGGVLINGSTFYIGLNSQNTFENEENLNITKGINAANSLISNYNPHFVIGGSNYYSLSTYLESIMDAEIPFFNIGVGHDALSQNVLNNYTRYKYFFNAIGNSSEIGRELITFELYLAGHLSNILSRPIKKVALIYNPNTLLMTNLVEALKIQLIAYDIDVVKEIFIDENTTKEDFINYWDQIDNAGSQLAFVGLYSENVKLLSEAYGEVKPRCLILSFNSYNFRETYWDDTYGGCKYEITCPAIFNISRTSRSIPYWNNFVNEYNHEPTLYAGTSYNAIYLILNATIDSQSLSASKVVESLEKIDNSNTFPGVGGKLAFTSSHSLFNGRYLGSEGYGSCMMGQWQTGGNRVIIHNYNDLIYPDSLATGSLQLPDWGVNIRFKINSPTKNTIFEDISPAFNIEILDAYDEAWYTINSGSTHYPVFTNGTINMLVWGALNDGPVRLNFYCNDSSGHIFKRYVDIIKDTEPPDVTIEPMETTIFGNEAPTITLNIQDASNITESYYSLDGGVTKIPFTGTVVTINQTLWDELGEGTVTISFYIIDSVGKETIVYIDVYKDLPGMDDMLLYVIIGIVALALGVMSTILYTQHRRKKRRKTEWVKLKKKKGLITPELAEGKNLIFISYATNDSDLFQIPLITDILVQYPEIDDILYWESDMHDDIYEYMDDNLKLCSVFLLFCTQNSFYSESVKMEWRSALKLDKKIIPVFINPNDIPPLLTTKLGIQFNESKVFDSIEALYQIILKKLEIPSTREFCKYLIPKSVSGAYFEEKIAPMVKKDLEIESDIPINDLKIRFISILEKNNFQFLNKPNDVETPESAEIPLISLRFFAEDKFEKQEIGLTATIQKREDDKSKIYLRVMGNKEWMVNEVLGDLGNKMYPLKTINELLREYSEKIGIFIDQLDNLEEFLREHLSVDFGKVEDIVSQYLSKQIEKDDFLKKGIQFLGKKFILIFIHQIPKIH